MLLFPCKRDLRVRIMIVFMYFLKIPNFCCSSCDLRSSGKGQCTPADQRLGPSITSAAKQLSERSKKSLSLCTSLCYSVPPNLKRMEESMQYIYNSKMSKILNYSNLGLKIIPHHSNFRSNRSIKALNHSAYYCNSCIFLFKATIFLCMYLVLYVFLCNE